MKVQIEIEIETERPIDIIEPYLRYSLKMLKIKSIKIKEKKDDTS